MTRRTLHVSGAIAIIALTTSMPSHAQDRPVIFLHGFNSNPNGWVATAERLRARAAIDTRTPTIDWRAPIADQAAELRGRPEYAALPGSALAVGHSNGGLVAREWAKRRGLDGVVTIGTPHRGLPIVPNYGHWVAFNADASWFSSAILTAFSRWTDWAWALGYVNEAISWVLDYSAWSTVFLGVTLGFHQAMPVAGDMLPYSLFLHNLNSTDNIDHERSTLPARIGVVSIAHNYFWAGPARAIAPEQADGIATALYAAAYGLLFWGNYILASADITDLDAMEQAMSLITLSNHMFAVDPLYCALVSSMDLSACLPNDGLIPYTSQEYPQAVNLYLGQDNDGPAHTREREASEDVLYYALVHVAGVPPRSSPPPPPGGESPGSGGQNGGGNSEDGGGQPPGGTCGVTGWSTTLGVDGVLRPDEQLSSASGCYRLIYQSDNNLVLYDASWTPLWASHTEGFAPGVVVMQSDGNLVLYDADWIPRWASYTDRPGSIVVLQDDGNVVVYGAGGEPLWASNSAR